MIAQSTYQIAANTAQAIYASLGCRVIPKSDSMLGQLNSLTYTGTEGRVIPAKEGQSVTTAELVASLTVDTAQASSSHTAAIGAMIDELSPVVAKHIAYVQTVVKPKFLDAQQSLQEKVSVLQSQSVAANFDVIQVAVSPLIDDEAFLGLVKRFGEGGIVPNKNLITLPVLTFQQLLDTTAVSSRATDATAKQWLAEKGEDWLLGVYTAFFASANMPQQLVSKESRYEEGIVGLTRMPLLQRIDVAVAVFLLARGFLDAMPENADHIGMTLAQWRDAMDTYSRFAGHQLDISLKQLTSMRQAGTVVVGISERSERVMVLADTYAAWLGAGGTVETLLGAVISERSSTYTANNLTENARDYDAIWGNYAAVGESSRQLRMRQSLIAHAANLYAMEEAKPLAEELELRQLPGYQSGKKTGEVADYLNSLTTEQLQDSTEVALVLVAKFRFDYTPAYSFLSDMLTAQKNGCKDAQEAAGVAALNYVCDYLSTHLTLVQQ